MNNRKIRIILTCLVFVLALGSAATVPAAAQSGKQVTKININTASAAELESLPRIGEKIAERILEFRKKNGPFKRIEDLMKVNGIGEKVYLQLKDRITVSTPGEGTGKK
jgi:comEA protein